MSKVKQHLAFPIALSPVQSATAIGRALAAFAVAAAFSPIPALSGPENGSVVSGHAAITTVGGVTTITQGTDRVVIDWGSFDIDADEVVEFVQPRSDSVSLNRVLSDLPTSIRGQLLANGGVFIVNQHGVTFHAGSVVNVGSLIATTSDISDANFMAGNYRFDRPGQPDAKVINEGSITFGQAGLTAFVAPGVENHGIITGQTGRVVIGGAETFAVDLAGDGLFAFTLGEDAETASAANTGSIHNPGGYILISATAAMGMVESQVSVGGVVEATSASVDEQGRIILSGGDGVVEITGNLDASGQNEGEVGGEIDVTGRVIHVRDSAEVDASGSAGGGRIRIGGAYQGGSELPTAERVVVGESASIRANTIGQVGDGGEVVLWSDDVTAFFGDIQARGGAVGGDGGFTEISGLAQLILEGDVDLSAPNGELGHLLLDPTDIVIVDGGSTATADILFADDGLNGDGTPGAGDGTSSIDADFINNAVAALTLQATNNITINEQFDSSVDLVLEAGNQIVANANMSTNSGADLTLNADSAIFINNNVSVDGNLILDADSDNDGVGTGITFAGAPFTVAGDVTLNSSVGVALRDIDAGSLTVTAGGAVTDDGVLTVGGVLDVTTTSDQVTLDNATNTFGSVAVDTTNAGADAAANVLIVEADATDLAGIAAADL
ncbi:MAG: filamentous hemagglutinin N-terminal domain-containing protein, partial [Pikeienuella sp.]